MIKISRKAIYAISLGALAICLIIILGFYYITTWQKQAAIATPAAILKSITPTSKRYWIMSTQALNELAIDSSAQRAIRNDMIFVPESKSEKLVSQTSGLHIVPVESFTSEASMAKAIHSESIDSSIKALLYDNEDWSLTPKDEQSNLVEYYQKAASLAHASGYLLIGTPVSKIDSRADIDIAPYIDVLDIQSQFDQSVASVYASHVLPLAQGAQKANPNLIILSGLSTNPPAGIPTAEQLANDARTVSGTVQGYWLNIPSPGTTCPKCNAPQPQIGIQFLDLYAQP